MGLKNNKYYGMIKENIAPKNTKYISVYKNNRKVGIIPLGNMSQHKNSKLYSFCAISDVHVPYDTAEADLTKAFEYVDDNDIKFTCICGDLTSNGANSEMEWYKRVADKAVKPIYAITGNHETRWGHITFDRPTPYTSFPLYYTIGFDKNGNQIDQSIDGVSKEFGDNVKDVFLMVGYTGDSKGNWTVDGCITLEELQYIYETLEKNRNKRCFVWHHVYPYQDKVGDACRYYDALYWSTIDKDKGETFKNLLLHYKNTILFHGHSHLRFHLQSEDKLANYGYPGYRSVHIPSLAVPRDRVDGATSVIYAESEGYVVDVYDDYIILNGMDFIDNAKDGMIIPLGTIKVDTQLVKIEPKTFVDTIGLLRI